MKKMITLCLAAGAFTAAVAQPPGRSYDRNRVDVRRYNNAYDATLRQRDAEIDRINLRVDRQIREIQFDPYLRRNQKRKMIDRVQQQRARQVNEVIATFNDSRRRFQQPYAYRY